MGSNRAGVGGLGQAAALAPQDAAPNEQRGNLLQELGRYQEAEDAYRSALLADPQARTCMETWPTCWSIRALKEALDHYAKAVERSSSPRLHIAAATVLPPIYRSHEEIENVRERLIANLRRLQRTGIQADPTLEELPTLFYLAYQGRNDRDIQALQASLVAIPKLACPMNRQHGDKIRVGFISRNFKNHTIGGLMAGTISMLDRSRFQVVVLSVSAHQDELGKRIRDSADEYVVVPSVLTGAIPTVARQNLDLLYYTDVGMDPFTYTLAFTRLAPVQCVTWGHPMTTGIPTMDYFISSEDLEGVDGAYTEQLVMLPTLPICYDRPVAPIPPKPRRSSGCPKTPPYMPAPRHCSNSIQTLIPFWQRSCDKTHRDDWR